MLNARSIQGIAVITIGIFLSLWLGMALVTNQIETLLKVGGVALLFTCIFLGRKIWLLLIFFTALNVPLIRGVSTVELGQAFFLGFTLILFLMRRQKLDVRFGELEVLMLLIAACILQVYIRNPVGIALFGAGDVGGRPYFEAALTFMASIVLGNIVVMPTEIKWAMRLRILGALMGIGLTALRMGGIGPEVSVESERRRAYGTEQGAAGRSGAAARFGLILSLIICSYRSPLRALLHPFWAFLILVSMAAVAASGFRNMVAWAGLYYLIAIAYRGGWAAVIGSSLAGAVALALLAIINMQAPLPPNIQRALSPFPGTWEERYIKEAGASTKWRVDMWKEALFTEHWIQNKLLGDGLGLTARELQMMQDSREGRLGGIKSIGSELTGQQVALMVAGGYHSGPVTTVRTIGYVGLLIMLLAMIRVAVHAHRQILRCQGTEWQPLAYFFGIPIIALPIFWTLVTGDFTDGSTSTFMAYAMVRLLEKNLPLPAYVPRRRYAHVPLTLRNRQQQAA